MNTMFNFAIDFVAINSAKSSEDLQKYVDLCNKDGKYPNNNEDNACVIALCLNVNLSEQQLLSLAHKYGKYIKQNPLVDMYKLINPDGEFYHIKDSNYTYNYNEFLARWDDCGEIHFSIIYNHDNQFTMDLVNDCNDPIMLRTIIYVNEILGETSFSYDAGKHLQKINPEVFEKIRWIWGKKVAEIFCRKTLFNRNIVLDESDFESVYPSMVVEFFKNYMLHTQKTFEDVHEIMNQAIRLVMKCKEENGKYVFCKQIILACKDYICLDKDLHDAFDGKLKALVDAINC